MQDLQVEKIKKGAVLFFLERKIELLQSLIDKDQIEEVKMKSMDNQLLEEWYNGRVTARKFDLETLEELKSLINKL
jgi:hypothetical protein